MAGDDGPPAPAHGAEALPSEGSRSIVDAVVTTGNEVHDIDRKSRPSRILI
jgi:hypothetical protein